MNPHYKKIYKLAFNNGIGYTIAKVVAHFTGNKLLLDGDQVSLFLFKYQNKAMILNDE
jgi:hypothetical protein